MDFVEEWIWLLEGDWCAKEKRARVFVLHLFVFCGGAFLLLPIYWVADCCILYILGIIMSIKYSNVKVCCVFQVHVLIEYCLRYGMDADQTVRALGKIGIDSRVTRIVWGRLEHENPEFFEEYTRTLRLSRNDGEEKKRGGGRREYCTVGCYYAHGQREEEEEEEEKKYVGGGKVTMSRCSSSCSLGASGTTTTVLEKGGYYCCC